MIKDIFGILVLCSCECDKLCDVGQYLDNKNCICRKIIADKLVEECINVVDGDILYNKTLSIDPNDCPSHNLILYYPQYFY